MTNPEHPSLLPHGESLRKAVRWLSHKGEISAETIEQASRQYDLSPREEDFLLRNFLPKPKNHAKTRR